MRFAKQLPCNSHFHLARLAHQAAATRFAMALDTATFLRSETIIAAIAPTLARVVPDVLWWCFSVHSARRPEVYGLRNSNIRVAGLICQQTRDHVMESCRGVLNVILRVRVRFRRYRYRSNEIVITIYTTVPLTYTVVSPSPCQPRRLNGRCMQ